MIGKLFEFWHTIYCYLFIQLIFYSLIIFKIFLLLLTLFAVFITSQRSYLLEYCFLFPSLLMIAHKSFIWLLSVEIGDNSINLISLKKILTRWTMISFLEMWRGINLHEYTLWLKVMTCFYILSKKLQHLSWCYHQLWRDL